jgi:hypothetical protein
MRFEFLATPDFALEFYKENGQEVDFDINLFNATLTIEAPDAETANKIRKTITDIRMWEKKSD